MTKTEVNFVDGLDDVRSLPGFAKAAALTSRFAVIQDTYRPDCVDMYFDEPLWRSLLSFCENESERVLFAQTQKGGELTEPAEFLPKWEAETELVRMPPPLIFGYRGDQIELAMETEYWCNSGGPMPYHDSFTYSFYTRHSISAKILEALATSNAERWGSSQPTDCGRRDANEVVALAMIASRKIAARTVARVGD